MKKLLLMALISVLTPTLLATCTPQKCSYAVGDGTGCNMCCQNTRCDNDRNGAPIKFDYGVYKEIRSAPFNDIVGHTCICEKMTQYQSKS